MHSPRYYAAVFSLLERPCVVERLTPSPKPSECEHGSAPANPHSCANDGPPTPPSLFVAGLQGPLSADLPALPRPTQHPGVNCHPFATIPPPCRTIKPRRSLHQQRHCKPPPPLRTPPQQQQHYRPTIPSALLLLRTPTSSCLCLTAMRSTVGIRTPPFPVHWPTNMPSACTNEHTNRWICGDRRRWRRAVSDGPDDPSPHPCGVSKRWHR